MMLSALKKTRVKLGTLPSVKPTLEHIIQPHGRFARKDGWRLDDISLCVSGIAVSGHNKRKHRSFVCVYKTVHHSDSRDKPTLLYIKEFEGKHSDDHLEWRRISFMEPNSTEIVTCQDDEVQVIDYNRDVVLRSCKVNLETRCLSVSESQIFIGFRLSNSVNIYDKDLKRIKSIRLMGMKGDDWPFVMTAEADRLYVCTRNGRAIVYSQNCGSILTEYDTDNAYSVTVNAQIAVVAVLWYSGRSKKQVDVNFCTDNKSLVVVDVESGVSRIRISDQGRIVTGNEYTGEVKIYDLVTYDFMKTAWEASLQTDDCRLLTDYFCMSKDQSDAILKSDTPAKALLLTLEEMNIMGVSNVNRLVQAFIALQMNETFYQVATVYQGKAKANSYDRFLATLSAHLTASVAGDLCDYFEISDEKTSITSSQNPGLSLLLDLHEMGVINQSRVGPLVLPFTKFRLVQAVAKILEYESVIEDEKDLYQPTMGLTKEDKRNLLVKQLQEKIKSWYDTMTPVPWKKSCRWKSSDLFVEGGLILTNSKTQRVMSDIDEQCKIHYTDLLNHVSLKNEKRIIIQGEEGSGKTMLSYQLAYDWSKGIVCDVNMFILLPLKCVETKTLVEAIEDFYQLEGKGLSLADIEDIITSEGRNCCFLLDGLEEYNGKDEISTEELSEVEKVMAKDKYPNCKVIITSRSGFFQDVPPCPMLKLGQFGEIQRHCYIEKVFSDDNEKQLEVKKFIDDTPFVSALCSVPLLFVLVVHNIEGMVSVKNVQPNRIAPFMGSMVETLCLSVEDTGLGLGHRQLDYNSADEYDDEYCDDHLYDSSDDSFDNDSQASLELFQKKSQMISIETLAFNGLCRGRQQLSWQKRFMEENVRNVKQYLDSGILVNEEAVNVGKAVDRGAQEVSNTDEFAVTALSEVSGGGGRCITDGGSTSQNYGSNQTEASGFRDNIDRSNMQEGGRGVKEGEITDISVNEQSQPVNCKSPLNPQYVQLQVKFLHKIIQEWFAAKHLADIFWNYRELSLQEKNNLFREHLQQINPADLHYMLRFTCALCPQSCHFILNYLHNTYSSKKRNIPEHVMNCICLCLAEYDGYKGHYIKDVISEVCKSIITIRSEDSRLLQEAKVSMLQFASKCKLPISRLHLSDVVVKATEDRLIFNSGAALGLLDTLQKIDIGRWDQTLREKEDYCNIVTFVVTCAAIKDAYLFFPSQPPLLHPDMLNDAAARQVKVTWHIGKFVQTLDQSKGMWQVVQEEAQITDGKDHLMTGLHKEQFIDGSGGTLFLHEADISLHVPAGALTEGYVLRVTVPVDPSVFFSGRESFPRTTPLIICEPDNLRFNQPVKLTLSHCAVLKNPRNHSVHVNFGHKAEMNFKEVKWVAETVDYLLDKHRCSVFLNHFSAVDVVIESVEEKKLRVIPNIKVEDGSKQKLTVWLCNDLESDLQSIMQSEKNDGGLPLNCYNTFHLQCVPELQEKLKVRLEVFEGSSWRSCDREKTIDVGKLSVSSKLKHNFQLVSDGSGDKLDMYLLLRVIQPVGKKMREATFALRKRICDIQIEPLKFSKPLPPNRQTNHIFPRGNSPQLFTACMDPVKHVMNTLLPSLFDSKTEMFQARKETLTAEVKVVVPSSKTEVTRPPEQLQPCFLYLSKKLGKNWRFVGRLLGVDDEKLDEIEADYPNMTKEAIYRMLRHWKQSQGSKAAYDALVEALKESGRTDLAEQLRNMQT